MHARRSDPPESQRRAVTELVAQGTLTEDQGQAVLAALASTGEFPSVRSHVAEVVGYLGGGLILAGAALLVGTSWERLTDAARVGIVGGITLGLLLAAVLIAGGPKAVRAMRGDRSTTRSRIAAVLLALASGTGALAAGTAAPSDRELLIAGLTGLVIAAATYAVSWSVPPLLAAGPLSLIAATGLAESIASSPSRMGFFVLPLGICWLVLSGLGVIRQRSLGFVVGGIIALIGAQQPLGSSDTEVWAYVLTALVAAGCVTWHLLADEPVLLLAGVIGVTLVVPEVVWDWTDGAVGGAAIVLIAGVVLLVASGLGLLLRSRTAGSAER